MVTIDLDVMERTVRRTQDYYDRHGIAFRPHIKTHKIPAIAHLQVEAGAKGITCQKLSEAEVFLASGLRDILIPYNIVGEAKAGAAPPPGAAGRHGRGPGRITVCVDSASTADGISRGASREGVEIGVEVECDTGMRRAGVQTPAGGRRPGEAHRPPPGLRFAGWMTYPTTPETVPFFEEASRLIEAGGLTAAVRSGGGTPHMWRAHEALPVVNEYRAGTYVYFDRNWVGGRGRDWDDCAMRVHMTVVSRPTRDRAILDGGSKTLSSDPRGRPAGLRADRGVPGRGDRRAVRGARPRRPLGLPARPAAGDRGAGDGDPQPLLRHDQPPG